MTTLSKLSSLRHKVDAIFSFATFRHLADPLGTYAQLFELLADNGILATDHHVKAILNEKEVEISEILKSLGLPSLVYQDKIKGVMTQKRVDKISNLKQQLIYKGVVEAPKPLNFYATITSPRRVYFQGDIKENNLLENLVLKGCYFPGLLGRRNPKNDANFAYTTWGREIFENLIFPAALAMQRYLEKRENVVTEGGYFSRYFEEALSIQEEKRRKESPEWVNASQPFTDSPYRI
ncbi:MAG: hypothetical protein ACRC4G_00180 [Alphaproteobacteria bacterium]